MIQVLVLIDFLILTYAKHEQYAGWKSYLVGPANKEQLKLLNDLTLKYKLDFLSHVTGIREGLVLVQPKEQKGFIKKLKTLRIPYKIHADDVKANLDVDDQRIAARMMENTGRHKSRKMPYDNYQELKVIYAYMEHIAARYPNVATVKTAGYSFEKRPIKYMSISTTNFKNTTKPVVFIDGGIHPREWISPPSVTWIIRQLVENVTEPDLLENFDWILIPVVNPDGYVYTFNMIRFWRKTRSTNTHPESQRCPGVDANRNFKFHWNTAGASDDPCSDVYAGNHAFSELETKVVRNLLHKYLNRTAFYLTMHSYGSMILYPFSHNSSYHSPNQLALHIVGTAMANAINDVTLPHFAPYVVGNSLLILQQAIAGASDDYAHSIGIPLSYTIELPGIEQGAEGFHLHPKYIEHVCNETWQGIAAGVRGAGY